MEFDDMIVDNEDFLTRYSQFTEPFASYVGKPTIRMRATVLSCIFLFFFVLPMGGCIV